MHPDRRFRDLVLIDLDGTLVHSVEGIHAACVRMSESIGIESPSLEFVHRSIGRGADVLVARVLSGGRDVERRDALHQAAREAFDHWYLQCWQDGTRIRDGAIETLEALVAEGREAIIATNKPGRVADEIVCHLGLDTLVSGLVTPDHAKSRKPHPDFVDHALSGRNRSRSVLIGDSMVDAETALNAGIPFVAISGGYNEGIRIEDSEIRDSPIVGGWDSVHDVIRQADGM